MTKRKTTPTADPTNNRRKAAAKGAKTRKAKPAANAKPKAESKGGKALVKVSPELAAAKASGKGKSRKNAVSNILLRALKDIAELDD
jgi:hypothetical protein